jgi:hypothetical protein
MKVMWGKDALVEVYDFEGDAWRSAIVLEPEFEIDGYDYLYVRYLDRPLDDQEPSVVWIAPELVERHVRAAAW